MSVKIVNGYYRIINDSLYVTHYNNYEVHNIRITELP
jgi:hypothetical protein